MFKNINMYSDSFLKSLSSAQLEILVENCFNTPEKNYELLAKIVPYLGMYQACPLFHAIKILEDTAVKVFIKAASKELLGSISSNEYSSPFNTLWEQRDVYHKDFSLEEKRSKIIEIADVLFNHYQLLQQKDFEIYAELTSSERFLLTVTRNISKLENISMPIAKIKEKSMEPLYIKRKFTSVEDILLSRSYSDIYNASEVKNIYSNMIHGSKLAENIAYNVAQYILDGDGIKIFINNHTGVGLYQPLTTTVYVGSPIDKFSHESVLVHELTHYLIFKKFNSGVPFDISKTHDFNAPKNSLYGLKIKNEKNIDPNSIQSISPQEAMYYKYEKAAQVFLLKAASLLKADIIECKKYQSSSALIEYLKDNTGLDLFMDNMNAKLDVLSTNLSIKKALYEAFYQHMQCTLDNKHMILYASDDKEIKKISREEYFPLLVKDLQLTSEEIFFLERVADLANNAQDIYDCPSSYFNQECKKIKHYIELLPRCVELSITPNISQDIIDSCKEIQNYWFENMYSVQEISLSGVPCVANE